MIWGYIRGTGGKPPVPLNLPIHSHSSALITGSSGTGKSTALLYLIGMLLQEMPDICVILCDFKNTDFSFLKQYPYYYSGNECYEGIMAYYEKFNQARETNTADRRCLLVCDEYPAFINHLSMLDKKEKTKKATDVLCAISEILMMGRGTAKGFGFWCVCQRPDANLFNNGARDNFMICASLGRLGKEHQHMLYADYDIPTRVYKPGEGILLADAHPLYDICFPRIRSPINWKKHIKQELMKYCDK